MAEKQDPEKIREVALDLDNTLEAMDKEKVLTFFTEDCEIKFLGKTLKGKDGVMKWLNWLESHGLTEMKLTPINVQVLGNTYLEEFVAKAILEDGTEVEADQCEVLTYENYKVKSLHLYFDRLQYAPMLATGIKGVVGKPIIKEIEKMTFEGL